MLPVVCCRSDIASSDAIFQRSFRRIRVIDFERSTILYHFHAFEISNGARGTDLKFKSIRSDHYRNFVTRLRADWHIFSDLERWRMDGWIPSLSRDPILDVSTFRRDRGGGRKRRARLARSWETPFCGYDVSLYALHQVFAHQIPVHLDFRIFKIRGGNSGTKVRVYLL